MGCSGGKHRNQEYNASPKEAKFFNFLGLSEQEINQMYTIYFGIDYGWWYCVVSMHASQNAVFYV